MVNTVLTDLEDEHEGEHQRRLPGLLVSEHPKL